MRICVRFPCNQTNQSDDIVPDDYYHTVYSRDLYILQESRVTYTLFDEIFTPEERKKTIFLKIKRF